jgi:hypothetical protein
VGISGYIYFFRFWLLSKYKSIVSIIKDTDVKMGTRYILSIGISRARSNAPTVIIPEKMERKRRTVTK